MSSGIELIGVVDPTTFSRGHGYAEQGMAQVIEHDPEEGYVRGTCLGSGPQVYLVEVDYDLSRHGVLHDLEGECSCPVGYNCKHVVAMVLTARRAERTPAASGPHWRSVLSEAFPEPERQVTPLALAVEFSPDRPSPAPGSLSFPWSGRPEDGILRVRPLRPGKRKPWVNAGATWSSVRARHINGAGRAQIEALEALRRLANQADPWSMGEPSWISLERINSGLWSALQQIVASGVELIATDYHAVTVQAQPGAAHVGIHQGDDGEIQVSSMLSHNKAQDTGDIHLLGHPPHGMVWADANGLHLAPLERPASPAWSTLHQAGGTVRVPAADRGVFEREVLPRILREDWTSRDDSYAPPAPPAPTLHLDIHVDALSPPGSSGNGHAGSRTSVGLGASGSNGAGRPQTPRAILAWSVHYRDDDGQGHGPLDLRPRPGDPTRDEPAEQQLLAAAAEALAPLPATIDDDVPHPRALLHGLDVVTLVDQVLPALAEAGVRVTTSDLPAFTDAGAPQVHISVSEADRDWFDLQITMTVAGHQVPISEVITSLTHGDPALFLPDGTYVLLEDPELERLRSLLAESYEMTDQRRQHLRVPRVQVSWWEELLGLGLVSASEHAWLQALKDAVTNPPEPPPLPQGIQASLRPYQVAGFEWLATLRRSGLGGILADDMGLGKTLQVLAMIADERTGRERTGRGPAPADREEPAGPWLVVAPTSVVPNWATEAARFTPDLRVAVVSSTQARRRESLADLAAGADIVITSYALLRLEAEQYADLGVAGLVLDEAQHAKNHTSKAFASAKKVQAPVTFAITGTPLENNLDELWAMTALVAPGLFGSPAQFRQTYRRPIERGEPESAALLARLRRRVYPFLLRRTKDQVATDLPPKQEQVLSVELTPAHRRIYDKHLQRERQRVLRLVDDLDRNRVEVLAALTRLRQLAIDASLVEPDAAAQSSKLEVLVPLLREAAAEGHRVLVFSQFTRYLGRIADRLHAEGLGYAYLDGSTKRRAEVIRGFAEGEDPVFLISLKAGGVGLNLTMADYAILADPWWNPAVEAQAIDRTHRIGQQRPVMVYRLVATDTIEEKVLALQETKRELVAGVLMADDDEAADATPVTSSVAPPARAGALSAEELRQLLA